ncbi:MAG: hypothetical protein ACYDHY_07345 [Acidiferrobacterales bacterium]
MIQIRVDDFPGTKPAEFNVHNLENFQKFHEIMMRYVPSYVLGIIPMSVTEEQMEWIWPKGEIRIAQHGVFHDERFQNDVPHYLTEKDTMEYLAMGANKIHGSKLYIPPRNVIDAKTVRVLLKMGFTTLFGGPGSDYAVLQYAQDLGLRVETSEPPLWYGRSDELLARGSVSEIMRAPLADRFLTLHWTWEMNIGLENLDKYLKEIAPALK